MDYEAGRFYTQKDGSLKSLYFFDGTSLESLTGETILPSQMKSSELEMIQPGIYLSLLSSTLNQAKKLIDKNFFGKKAYLMHPTHLMTSSQDLSKCAETSKPEYGGITPCFGLSLRDVKYPLSKANLSEQQAPHVDPDDEPPNGRTWRH
jgi:hypothetical protein